MNLKLSRTKPNQQCEFCKQPIYGKKLGDTETIYLFTSEQGFVEE